MFHSRIAGAILCLLLSSCHQSSLKSFAKYDLGGGRYYVEIEDTQGGTSLKFDSHSEGKVVMEEQYDLSWGKSHQLRIENGKLAIDGVDFGGLQPGDRIIAKVNGDILVNGAKR